MKGKYQHMLVGLGNMGNQYHNTRHNVGFMCIDYLVNRGNLRYREKASFASQYAEYNKIALQQPSSSADSNPSNYSCIILRPYSFMNIIGKNVKLASKHFGVEK